MKRFAFALMILVSCSVAERREVFVDKPFKVVYNDFEAIKLFCGHNVRACWFPDERILYCNTNDLEGCGHELRHITDGRWHK